MITSTCSWLYIIALRNEKGSYNLMAEEYSTDRIIALRNEKGSYNCSHRRLRVCLIIALRNEKGSYNWLLSTLDR